jgi:hypothetical protein
MSWVWDHSQAEGNARLVLLAIADNAGHDGRDAWPSQETLARKCRVSVRTVRRAIKELVDLGELEVQKYAGPVVDGRDGRRTHRYVIHKMADNLTGNPEEVGGQIRQVGGQIASGCRTRVSGEPSLTVPRTSVRADVAEVEVLPDARKLSDALRAKTKCKRDTAMDVVETLLTNGASEEQVEYAIGGLGLDAIGKPWSLTAKFAAWSRLNRSAVTVTEWSKPGRRTCSTCLVDLHDVVHFEDSCPHHGAAA